jgi:hypothetical protein
MFIVYRDDSEVIVTTRKREKRMLKEFFGPGMGRDLNNYDREEITNDAVWIGSSFRVS